MREKKQHIEDGHWERIARFLYDDSHETIPDDIPGEIAETAREVDLYYKLKQFDAAKALTKVRKKIYNHKSRLIIFYGERSFLKIAAVVVFALLVASAGFLVGSRYWGNEQSGGVVVDQYGISKITLADGSLVTLNRDTRIDYPDKFREDVRDVRIEGEAFFEVKSEPSRPFIIHAGGTTIKVLGTSFNVSAYPDREKVEVVVRTGKVQVTKSGTAVKGGNAVILDPGDKGVFINQSRELLKAKNDNPNFLSWKTRDFTFNKASLNDVIHELNNVYRVHIRIEDPETGNLFLTARFEDRTPDFILKVIALTHHLSVKKEDDCYILQKSS